MRAQGRDALARPSITVAGDEAVPVQDAGDKFVIGDQNKEADSGDDVRRGAVALTSTALRQAKFGSNAAGPVNRQDDLGRILVDIRDCLLDDGSHDTLLEAGVRRGRSPDRLQIGGERGEVRRSSRRCHRGRP